MESRRDASNRTGVITCSKDVGGTSGPDGTIRAVGKCLGYEEMHVKIENRVAQGRFLLVHPPQFPSHRRRADQGRL
jgi:hypothetical protein